MTAHQGQGHPPVVIRRMALRDANAVAELHAKCLPHGFFPDLGLAFLREYYRGYALSPYAVALVADRAGEPVGMAVGPLSTPDHHRWLLRGRGWRLAALVGAGLLRPRAARRFIRTRLHRYLRGLAQLRRARGGRLAGDAPDRRPPAILSYVAVAHGLQRNGIGTRLVDGFTTAAEAAGVESVRLTTRPGADGASGFYSRRGWRQIRTTMDWDDRPTVLMGLDLPVSEAADD